VTGKNRAVTPSLAPVDGLQPLSYVALKHLVRRRDTAMTLVELAKLVPLAPVVAEETCRALMRRELIEVYPTLQPLGSSTKLTATQYARQLVEDLERDERSDAERLHTLVTTALANIDGRRLDVDTASTEASQLRQAIWQEARYALGIELDQPPSTTRRQQRLLDYLSQYDPDLYTRLQRRAHLDAFWKHLWLNESFYEKLRGLKSISFFLDTNVLIGALVTGDRWHEATLPMLVSLNALGQHRERLTVELFLADETLEELEALLGWTERLVRVVKRLGNHLTEAPSAAESLRRFGLVRHYLMSGSSSFAGYRRHLMSQLQSLMKQCGIRRARRISPARSDSPEYATRLPETDHPVARHDISLLRHARSRAHHADPTAHSWVWTYDYRLSHVAHQTLKTRANVAYGPLLTALVQWLWLVKAEQAPRFDAFQKQISDDIGEYFRGQAVAERNSQQDIEKALKWLVRFYANSVQNMTDGPSILAQITEACYRVKEMNANARIVTNGDSVAAFSSNIADILGLPVDWFSTSEGSMAP